MGPLLAVKAFFTALSPTTWKYIAIAVAFGAVYAYADRKATYREQAACEAAAQRAQKAADAQDVKAAVEQKEIATKVASDLLTQKAEDEKIIEDLKVKLAGQPLNAPCYYPDVAPTGRVRSQPPAKGAGNAQHPRPSGLPTPRARPLDIRP